jgi:signal transduction histidine kinase
LSNLVGNAFAHTDAGEVRIDVEQGRLRIANSGDAADPATRWEQQQAFSKREGSSGFGLGFAIVRSLCDRHGVDLRIESAQGRVVASIAVDSGPATPSGGAR